MTPADIEAALALAQFIQSSIALYKAGHMSAEQIGQAFAAAGVSVKTAGQVWDQSKGPNG